MEQADLDRIKSLAGVEGKLDENNYVKLASNAKNWQPKDDSQMRDAKANPIHVIERQIEAGLPASEYNEAIMGMVSAVLHLNIKFKE